MDEIPLFKCVEDECRYWKEKAKFYYTEWTDTKQEFDEYVIDSRQLEAELEVSLDQKEKLLGELRKKIFLLETESQSMRVKLESLTIEFKTIEKQLASTQIDNESLKKYLRQLEQQNDDLERGYRILSETISGIKTDLDRAYEKNALLEIEVDEKEILREKLQRLMDETRDLKQEINVKDRLPCTSPISAMNVFTLAKACHPAEVSLQNSFDLCQRSKNCSNGILNGNAIASSSKTTALNIVADMLRKLNAMETKLKDYREHIPCQRK